jgi:hypothetical protein
LDPDNTEVLLSVQGGSSLESTNIFVLPPPREVSHGEQGEGANGGRTSGGTSCPLYVLEPHRGWGRKELLGLV